MRECSSSLARRTELLILRSLCSLTKTEATIAAAINKLIAAKPRFAQLGVAALGKKE